MHVKVYQLSVKKGATLVYILSMASTIRMQLKILALGELHKYYVLHGEFNYSNSSIFNNNINGWYHFVAKGLFYHNNSWFLLC